MEYKLNRWFENKARFFKKTFSEKILRTEIGKTF